MISAVMCFLSYHLCYIGFIDKQCCKFFTERLRNNIDSTIIASCLTKILLIQGKQSTAGTMQKEYHKSQEQFTF